MRVAIHNQAPPVADGVSPFQTPGTRLAWSSGLEWTAAFRTLHARRCTTKRHTDLAAHLDELARHPDFLDAQPLEDLEAIADLVRAAYEPPRGRRAGTSYERVINDTNNAIARARRFTPETTR